MKEDGGEMSKIRMVIGGGLLVFAGVMSLPVSAVELPGEKAMKPAISPAPFPDRMSAYVWRNWGLVDKATLAKVVGATAEDLTEVAEQMGLPPDPAVLPEWRRKG